MTFIVITIKQNLECKMISNTCHTSAFNYFFVWANCCTFVLRKLSILKHFWVTLEKLFTWLCKRRLRVILMDGWSLYDNLSGLYHGILFSYVYYFCVWSQIDLLKPSWLHISTPLIYYVTFLGVGFAQTGFRM